MVDFGSKVTAKQSKKDMRSTGINTGSRPPQVITGNPNTIYIDPTNSAGGRNGSYANPYNSFAEVASYTNGKTYAIKRGTTIENSATVTLTGKTGIFITSYGSGEMPKINYSGTGSQNCAVMMNSCTDCSLAGVEIEATATCFAIVRVDNGSGNIIAGNKLHRSYYTDYNNGMGIRAGGCSGLSILNNEIYDTGCDGAYLRDVPDCNFGYNNIHHVNQQYAVVGTVASGDGVQFDGLWSNFWIHHNTIDRSDANTGHKFNLIVSSANGINDSSSGIIEHNQFINRANADIPYALYIQQGNGIVTRYNTFKGLTGGIRVTGVTTSNNKIHNNIFYDCTMGVGVAYTDGSPLNTMVWNNVFYHVTNYHVWTDRTTVDMRNNIHMRAGDPGVALYRYNGGAYVLQNSCFDTAATAGRQGTGTNPVIGDPGFEDAVNKNFRLLPDSICRNAGVNVGIATDIDGTAIPQDTLPDIGAYEFKI